MGWGGGCDWYLPGEFCAVKGNSWFWFKKGPEGPHIKRGSDAGAAGRSPEAAVGGTPLVSSFIRKAVAAGSQLKASG